MVGENAKPLTLSLYLHTFKTLHSAINFELNFLLYFALSLRAFMRPFISLTLKNVERAGRGQSGKVWVKFIFFYSITVSHLK